MDPYSKLKSVLAVCVAFALLLPVLLLPAGQLLLQILQLWPLCDDSSVASHVCNTHIPVRLLFGMVVFS